MGIADVWFINILASYLHIRDLVLLTSLNHNFREMLNKNHLMTIAYWRAYAVYSSHANIGALICKLLNEEQIITKMALRWMEFDITTSVQYLEVIEIVAAKFSTNTLWTFLEGCIRKSNCYKNEILTINVSLMRFYEFIHTSILIFNNEYHNKNLIEWTLHIPNIMQINPRPFISYMSGIYEVIDGTREINHLSMSEAIFAKVYVYITFKGLSELDIVISECADTLLPRIKEYIICGAYSQYLLKLACCIRCRFRYPKYYPDKTESFSMELIAVYYQYREYVRPVMWDNYGIPTKPSKKHQQDINALKKYMRELVANYKKEMAAESPSVPEWDKNIMNELLKVIKKDEYEEEGIIGKIMSYLWRK